MFVISGEAQISIVDPDTNKLHSYVAKPGQVCFYSYGLVALDHSYFRKIAYASFFNNDQFETALGSNMLKLTGPPA